jgi:hypothetical protein
VFLIQLKEIDMNRRPYASDWKEVRWDLEYSAELNRYWHNGRLYDELSASHNGLTGLGRQLKDIIKERT